MWRVRCDALVSRSVGASLRMCARALQDFQRLLRMDAAAAATVDVGRIAGDALTEVGAFLFARLSKRASARLTALRCPRRSTTRTQRC